MAYFSTASASERRNLTGKNRVWNFFPLSNETHPANRRQPAQARRKIHPTPMKTASGIPCWPSRDPIGEVGGLNLYGLGGNSGVNGLDVLGLAFADGSKFTKLQDFGATGLTYLDGTGGYTYEIDGTVGNANHQIEVAVNRHEELHISRLKASKQDHAIPYKQLFCRHKRGESPKYWFYSKEKGRLAKTAWDLGGLIGREKIVRNLLWGRGTMVYPMTNGDEATEEEMAHSKEINDLQHLVYKTKMDGTVALDSAGKKTRLPGVGGAEFIITRIDQTLTPKRDAHSARKGDGTAMNNWAEFLNAYINERNEAANSHEDFSWPITEIIYNELR